MGILVSCEASKRRTRRGIRERGRNWEFLVWCSLEILVSGNREAAEQGEGMHPGDANF